MKQKLSDQAQTFDSYSKFFAFVSKEYEKKKRLHEAWKYRCLSEMSTELMIITQKLEGFMEEAQKQK